MQLGYNEVCRSLDPSHVPKSQIPRSAFSISFHAHALTVKLTDIAGLVLKLLMQGSAILKVSLQSKSVLTDVFLHANNNKNAPGPGAGAFMGYQFR